MQSTVSHYGRSKLATCHYWIVMSISLPSLNAFPFFTSVFFSFVSFFHCYLIIKWVDPTCLCGENSFSWIETCKGLHLGKNNPVHKYMQRADHLKSSISEKTLGVLMDSKLNTSQQYNLAAEKVNGILDYIRRNAVSWWRWSFSCIHSALVRPHLESHVQFGAP